MGLTIVPEPDPDMPAGHAVIPELSLQEYTRTKERLKEIHEQLARLASDNIILPFREGPLPGKPDQPPSENLPSTDPPPTLC
jgi:hypothetical protein